MLARVVPFRLSTEAPVLQPGIRIQTLDPLLTLEGIVELSSRPNGLSDQSADDLSIAERAWIDVPEPLKQTLIADRPAPLPDCVSLLRIDSKFRENFWREVAPIVLSDAEHPKSARTAALSSFCDELMSWVSLAGRLQCRSIRSADVQITPAGRSSTSFDYVRRAYVGLHVDDHQRLSMADRRHAFQVLCVNLGNEARHFAFVNVPLPEIAQWLAAKDETKFATLPSREITARFFEYFADYPIVRVKLAPNWAYVATTQYFIHDGVPNDKAAPDVALLVSGYFEHPEFSNETREHSE